MGYALCKSHTHTNVVVYHLPGAKNMEHMCSLHVLFVLWGVVAREAKYITFSKACRDTPVYH